MEKKFRQINYINEGLCDKEVVMYSGKKDKNGVEIYEKDIVSILGDKGEIILEDGMFQVAFQGSNSEYLYVFDSKDIQVIGGSLFTN